MGDPRSTTLLRPLALPFVDRSNQARKNGDDLEGQCATKWRRQCSSPLPKMMEKGVTDSRASATGRNDPHRSADGKDIHRPLKNVKLDISRTRCPLPGTPGTNLTTTSWRMSPMHSNGPSPLHLELKSQRFISPSFVRTEAARKTVKNCSEKKFLYATNKR